MIHDLTYNPLNIMSFSYAYFYIYHDPTKNYALPFNIYLFIFIFFSIRSLNTGVSHKATLEPRTAKYNPTNPTPHPNYKTLFPVKLS